MVLITPYSLHKCDWFSECIFNISCETTSYSWSCHGLWLSAVQSQQSFHHLVILNSNTFICCSVTVEMCSGTASMWAPVGRFRCRNWQGGVWPCLPESRRITSRFQSPLPRVLDSCQEQHRSKIRTLYDFLGQRRRCSPLLNRKPSLFLEHELKRKFLQEIHDRPTMLRGGPLHWVCKLE